MFKKQGDELDDFKKKREQYSINIRRNNRQELLNKRRNIVESATGMESTNTNENIVDSRYGQEIKEYQGDLYNENRIDQYVGMLGSTDALARHKGIIALRILMDSDNMALISKFVEKGYTHVIVALLTQNEFPQLKLQAVWLTANMTFVPAACEALVNFNILPICFKLLDDQSIAVIDHALVILGNISADTIKYRDLIIAMGGIETFCRSLANSKRESTFQDALWAMTNLCRGSPFPNFSEMESAIPILCRSLKNKMFQQVDKKKNVNKLASDVLWALSNFSESADGSKNRIDRIIQEDTLQIILIYTLNKSNQIYLPAIRVVGNIACLGEFHTNLLIKNGIFELAGKLLNHPKKQIRREVCWILSNLAAAPSSQVSVFLGQGDLLDKLNDMLISEQWDVKQEICWIFANLGFLGNKAEVVKLYLHNDLMKTFTQLLDIDNVQLLENALKTLFKMLLIGNRALVDGNNILLQKFMDYGGVDKVEKLQHHESSKIYKNAVAILTRFFEVEDNN